MKYASSRARVFAYTAALAAWALAAAACGDDGGGNALANGGFEDGSAAWVSLTTEGWEPRFDIATGIVHGGGRSAYLKMRTDAATGEQRIFGVTQDITPASFPEQLRGFYRVENWQRATPKQYLQVVVVVFNADNRPEARFPNHQIRYIFAGVGSPPFAIGNAKFVFLHPEDPEQGAWVPFTLDVAEDFRRLWGAVPAGFDSVRLLFEVRFDDKAPEERPSADVYYDDLYFGPRRDGAPP